MRSLTREQAVDITDDFANKVRESIAAGELILTDKQMQLLLFLLAHVLAGRLS